MFTLVCNNFRKPLPQPDSVTHQQCLSRYWIHWIASFLFSFFFFFLHVGLLIPEISCGLVRNSSRFFQHVIPLETMLKGQSPGQLPGRYTLHDCWEIEPFGCIFCLFGGHFTVIIVVGGVAVYSSNNKMGQFKLWMLKKYIKNLIIAVSRYKTFAFIEEMIWF